MKTKSILVLAILTMIIVISAGCVQSPASEGTTEGSASVSVSTPDREALPETETEPEVEPEEPTTPLFETECETDEDCDDGDKCTTDLCDNGKCKSNPIAGCEIKESADPYIKAVNFVEGDKDWIELRANNYRVDNWKIENQDGEVFYTFKKYTTLNNYLKIHSDSGFASNFEWYMKTGDFWKPGDTAILKNENGEVVSELQG